MSWFLFLIGLLFPVLAAAATWSRGAGTGAHSRVDAALAVLDGVVALALMRAIVPWAALSEWLWWVPVLVLAGAAAGLVWTWGERPAWRPGRTVRRSALWAGAHTLIALALLAVLS